MNTRDQIALNERFGAGNYESLPVVLSRGEGIYVWDVEGNRYYDMLSAYSSLNQGHCHPRIVAAAKKQLGSLTHTSRAFHNDQLGPYLETLVGVASAKNSKLECALPMNSGAEGVETAIKLMRRWGYRKRGVDKNKAEIIVAENNFHGRTTTIVGFSSNPDAYGDFGPATPGFVKVPFNDADAVMNAINPNTAGVLLEPIQGEAGVIIPDDSYLLEVRKICYACNVLMCVDEIQTGLGRTGSMFCYEHYGVEPDVVIVGKALGGGIVPVSAVLASRENMGIFTPGSHGSTFGGYPLACAVAKESLDVIVDEDLPGRSRENGAYFLGLLKEHARANPKIKEVRGKGLFIAVEFYEPVAHELCLGLMRESVLAKDTHNRVIRFAPPLVIGKSEIDDAMNLIRNVF